MSDKYPGSPDFLNEGKGLSNLTSKSVGIRLHVDTLAKIDTLRTTGQSRNDWIHQAIREKIARSIEN